MSIDPKRLQFREGMEVLVLFGGGDGGGFGIRGGKIVKIPPFDPPLLRQVRDVERMLDKDALDEAEPAALELVAAVEKHAASSWGIDVAMMRDEVER